MGTCCNGQNKNISEVTPLIEAKRKEIEPFYERFEHKENTISKPNAFDLFIYSYYKENIVPNIIKHLIQKYCCCEANPNHLFAYLISYRIYDRDKEKITALHVSSDKLYSVKNVDDIFNVNWRSFFVKDVTLNNICLPQYIIKKQMENNQSLSSETLNSNKWAMSFPEHPHKTITAYHLDLLQDNVLQPFTFKLPKMPISINESTMEKGYPLTFSHETGTLYAANIVGHEKSIWSLDFNNYNDKWKWKTVTKKLFTKRHSTSICMMENDKFMAILGGASNDYEFSKLAELYSFESNKCIQLSDMNRGRRHAISLYHEYYVKTIIGERWSTMIEWYDIIKDKWMMLNNDKKDDLRTMTQMYISNNNPNILFYSGCAKHWKVFQPETDKFEMYQIDLRTEKSIKVLSVTGHRDDRIIFL